MKAGVKIKGAIGHETSMMTVRICLYKNQNKINNKISKVVKQNKIDKTAKKFPICSAHSPFDSKLGTLGFDLLQLENTVSTV